MSIECKKCGIELMDWEIGEHRIYCDECLPIKYTRENVMAIEGRIDNHLMKKPEATRTDDMPDCILDQQMETYMEEKHELEA